MSVRTATILIVSLAWAALAGGRVLVYDHDNGQVFTDPGGNGKVGTEYGVKKALTENGVVDYEVARVLPGDLSAYDAVFVLCGVWPRDGLLPLSVQNTLRAYLDAGGSLYLEGTEVSMRYGGTPLFAYTGAAFADDGRPCGQGNVNVLQTLGDWAGLSFDYYSYREDKPDAYVDELIADGGDVMIRSKRAGNRSNARVVRYENAEKPRYRTIVSAFIFGAVKSGSHHRNELMAKYLEFFGLQHDAGTSGAVVPASFGRVRAMLRG
jgi:hypothetical protein